MPFIYTLKKKKHPEKEPCLYQVAEVVFGTKKIQKPCFCVDVFLCDLILQYAKSPLRLKMSFLTFYSGIIKK